MQNPISRYQGPLTGGNAEMLPVTSLSDFNVASANRTNNLLVVHFFSLPGSPECAQMDDVIREIIRDHPRVRFFKIDVSSEETRRIAAIWSIQKVPAFILTWGAHFVQTITGADPRTLLNKIYKLEQRMEAIRLGERPHAVPIDSSESEDSLEARLKKLVESSRVMVFLKGTPDYPKCGGSRQMVEILQRADIKYKYFDVTTDEKILNGIKRFLPSTSMPQLYLYGDYLGNVKTIQGLIKAGEFHKVYEITTSIYFMLPKWNKDDMV
ncbi:glutaredoxin-3 [Galendromus occidentalis]|uniref:Glutaredoxin-3 n=1 Tax=Galendromus occidentalis TaxID=34638 RepID=A0AAJ6QQT4_9ACAR|nr:glutaredoxin-3 [Galendromus occidentalis]